MKDAQHVQAFTLSSMRDIVTAQGFSIERLGTMYLWSPLLALFSDAWADRAVRTEVTRGIRNGALIHCLAAKEQAAKGPA